MSRASSSLGDLLRRRGQLNADQLRVALQEQARNRQPLGELLVRMGFVTEGQLRDVLAEQGGLPSVDLRQTQPTAEARASLPDELVRRHQILPLALDAESGELVLAIGDINDLSAIDRVRSVLGAGCRIQIRLAAAAELRQAITRHYGDDGHIEQILAEMVPSEQAFSSSRFSVDEASQPQIRLLDALIGEAVRMEASDIHFEPEDGFLRIRYRIDGVLREMRNLHRGFWPAMLVRLKVMGGMDIAEMRAPQDGRFSLESNGRTVDFRVSAHPVSYGENVVLRILDRHRAIVPLAGLGLDEAVLSDLRRIVARPEGIILVTGPTGSGKTTTLYSILSQLNQPGVNIMTLEDPVEYPLPMLRQTSLNESVKLDFASGIRSMMRQDPDIILIGEVRDQATAEMAFRAAMTGHQVYSTLHSNSAIGALPRLRDIGVRPEIMAGNISGILAQRLVRRLCPACREASEATLEERAWFGDVPVYRATGCPACSDTGYRGRVPVMELLVLDRALDELIADRSSAGQILQAAGARGFRTLMQDGVGKVRAGATSPEELVRVLGRPEAP